MKFHDIIESKYKRYTAEIIETIKAFPLEARLSGDDSPLESVWDEMRYQMQTREYACDIEVYEDAVRNCCRGLVETLHRDEQALLWLWSDAYYNNMDEWRPSEIPYGDPIIEAVEQEFYERVWKTAEEDELPDEKLDR